MSINHCQNCNSNKLPENSTACATGDCLACENCVCPDCHRCKLKHCIGCEDSDYEDISDPSE